MLIQSKYFGEITIEDQDIIHFSSGIPGFPEEKQFVILPIENSVFFIMQSVNNEHVAFVIVEPFIFFPQYEFDLPEVERVKLTIEKEEDVAVFVILTIGNPIENTTANLQAPVIINQNQKLGKQMILQNQDFSTKESIYKKIASTSKGGSSC